MNGFIDKITFGVSILGICIAASIVGVIYLVTTFMDKKREKKEKKEEVNDE